jgi:hypothetical protein
MSFAPPGPKPVPMTHRSTGCAAAWSIFAGWPSTGGKCIRSRQKNDDATPKPGIQRSNTVLNIATKSCQTVIVINPLRRMFIVALCLEPPEGPLSSLAFADPQGPIKSAFDGQGVTL